MRMLQWPITGLIVLLLVGCGGWDSSSDPRGVEVTITEPASGSRFTEGDAVELSGEAVGSEGQALTGEQLVWTTGSWDELGTGHTVTSAALTAGQHTFVLTATDPEGESATASVTVVATASDGPPPRFGESNPLRGRLARTAEKLDDEVVVIGAGASAEAQLTVGIIADPLGYYETDFRGEPILPGEPVAPTEVVRRDNTQPVAAAAGRVLDSNLQQVALVSAAADGSGPMLELFGVFGSEPHRLAEHGLPIFLLNGPLGITVADLDAFDEQSGERALTPPSGQDSRYHDEVALAYTEVANGEHWARVTVLSFEEIDFPEEGDGELPGPTSEVSIQVSRPLWPGSKIVVRHGDGLTVNHPGPHLMVAYLDENRRIAVDVFGYRRVRNDPQSGTPRTDTRTLVPIDLLADSRNNMEHLVVSDPLAEAAANAGGWDIGITTGHQVGTADNPLQSKHLLHVVWHENGFFEQAVWDLDSPDGFADPNEIAATSGAFGHYDGSAFGDKKVPLSILPDSPMQLAFGRVTQPGEFCEAIGLLVLADTNRGAVVQDLWARDLDRNPRRRAGNVLGLITEEPVWPGLLTLRDRGETDRLSRTSLTGGGFVFERNALIDERGNPSGISTQYAEDCPDTNTDPYLGPMPSFYVAEPETSQLHSVTISLGRTGGGGGIVTAPLGEAMARAPILLAADLDGNAGYYSALNCIHEQPSQNSPSDCRRIYLADAELHYALKDLESKSVILQQPPKHVDYLPALGGIADVSMSDSYFAQFSQTDTAGGSIAQENKTDWKLGSRAGGSVGIPAPPGTTYEPLLSMHLDTEVGAITESFELSEVSVSLTQTTGAVDDDVVWSRMQTIDFWRFPAQGGKPEGNAEEESDLDEDAYMDISVPGEPVTMIGPGVLNESYQPEHQVGNILTYPAFHGEVRDLGELFNYLGNYIPSDGDGARQCNPVDLLDELGCVIRGANDLLHRVTEVHPDDDFVGGRFVSQTNAIDVAEVLQVGGISYSAELQFDEQVRSGRSVTYHGRVDAELASKAPIVVPVQGVPLQVGEVESQVRASAGFESALISENTLGSSASISLHVPSSIPAERSYRIRPSFGYSPEGTLKVAYQVSTDGAASDFWEAHYSAPDPALKLPHRIVRTPDGYRLGTDFSRNRLRGFFVRDGSGVDPLRPAETAGPLFSGVPSAGEPVQLEVRVYNLSVGTPVSNLAVQFEAQRYEQGSPVGERLLLGESTVDYLPHRGQFPEFPKAHIASAYYLWDTADFGPPDGETLASYLIYVTLDPDDAIPGEVHELFDRNDDPLLSSSGKPLDEALEKGQNNRGWARVRIAPPLSAESSMQALSSGTGGVPSRQRLETASSERESVILELSRLDGDRDSAVIGANVGEAIELRVAIHSDSLQRAYGRLQVFDGNPVEGGQVILSRTVQGLSGGTVTHEDFTWRPTRVGDQSLHVVYIGGQGSERQSLKVPVRIGD